MSQLTVRGLSKRFGGNEVLHEVGFELRGRSLALVGPNGAGKTTLLNTLAGVVRPSAGSIRYEGRELAGLPSWKIAGLGLIKTQQVVRPFPSLTVDEHVLLFAHDTDPGVRTKILRETGLEAYREYPASDLPFGILKRLELAEALSTDPKLLLLDEPIGGLSRAEAEGVIATLRVLREGGYSMIIVEHRLREILPFVDTVLALDHGRVIYDGPPSTFYDSDAVHAAYLGRSHAGN